MNRSRRHLPSLHLIGNSFTDGLDWRKDVTVLAFHGIQRGCISRTTCSAFCWLEEKKPSCFNIQIISKHISKRTLALHSEIDKSQIHFLYCQTPVSLTDSSQRRGYLGFWKYTEHDAPCSKIMGNLGFHFKEFSLPTLKHIHIWQGSGI